MLTRNDTDQFLRMQTDLKLGLPILVSGKLNIYIIFATESITKDNFVFFMNLRSGKPIICVTARRARTLKARVYDENICRIEIPGDSDLDWIKATADPLLDLQKPMKGPYKSMRDEDSNIARLAIDWCKRAKLIPSAVIRRINKKQAKELKEKNQILSTDYNSISPSQTPILLRESATARIPIRGIVAQMRVFQVVNDNLEHCALEFGNPDRKKPVLTRVHSACFTGDILGSQKCDCGTQLSKAIEAITSKQEGLMLYLNQEGRGIGLVNKIKAYNLQEQGFDTVEANHRLGFEDEERDFQVASEILLYLGFSSARLLTNNPKKVKIMESAGINVVERVSLLTEPNASNLNYLQTKAKKSGHLFNS